MWVARDKDGTLFLYGYKPTRHDKTWFNWNGGLHPYNIIELPSDLFSNITWETGPVEISIIPTEALKSLYTIIDNYKNY